jgi:hypothetical protein
MTRSVANMMEFKRTREAARLRVIATYKSEIFDWCGHVLAVELTAQKTGLREWRSFASDDDDDDDDAVAKHG